MQGEGISRRSAEAGVLTPGEKGKGEGCVCVWGGGCSEIGSRNQEGRWSWEREEKKQA